MRRDHAAALRFRRSEIFEQHEEEVADRHRERGEGAREEELLDVEPRTLRRELDPGEGTQPAREEAFAFAAIFFFASSGFGASRSTRTSEGPSNATQNTIGFTIRAGPRGRARGGMNATVRQYAHSTV